jgi:hypothetical protein
MKKITSIVLFNLFVFLLTVNITFAQVSIPATMGASFGLGTINLYSTLINIVNVMLSFLGVISLMVILLGGFKWMVSGGNEEKVANARQSIVAGIIGLAIMLSSFSVVQFVVTNVAQ